MASGRLWRDTLILYDTATETLWSQLLGRAVQGKLDGRALEHLPSARMSWSEWRTLHPHTKALARPADIKGSHYQRYFDAEDKLGISGRPLADGRLPGKHAVLGLVAGDAAIAVAVAPDVRDVTSVNLEGERVLVVHDGKNATAWKSPDQQPLRWADDGLAIESRRDHRRWHPWTGGPLSLDTEPLESVPSVLTYWFTWSRYHPETALLRR